MIIGGDRDHTTTLYELTDGELLTVAKMLTQRDTPEPVFEAIKVELARRVALHSLDVALDDYLS